MIKVFSKDRNTIGNLAIALLLLGSCVFIFISSRNAPETVAASCYCGEDTTATTLTTENTDGCCGGTNKVSDDHCSGTVSTKDCGGDDNAKCSDRRCGSGGAIDGCSANG